MYIRTQRALAVGVSASEIEIPEDVARDYDEDTDDDTISDYLSDVTGFCHYGYQLVK